MRHGDKVKNLGRKKAHRDALLSNLACQLIQYKKIVTTTAKAKALRVYVEPLITKGKENTTHQRRVVFSYLQDKEAIKELFGSIAEKVGGRPGGYTRIIKLGARVGDNAETAMIELVDFNEIYGKGIGEEKTGAKRTRRSGGSKKTVTETAAPEAKASKGKVKDDLQKIEGVGPKVEEALHEYGINSYADLAKESAENIKTILIAADGNFGGQDPTTWPEQAALAAKGKWEELKEWQDKLMGGKEVE
ncbi:MAG: 50S ribosomal protein L17 [Chitinophagaceae bacterium]